MQTGRFQFCLPGEMQPVVDMALGDDPELGGGMVTPYGYSAFGVIHGWHRTLGRCDVDVLDKEVLTIVPESERERAFKLRNGPDVEIAIDLSGIDEICDTFDDDGERMFEPALAALGPLDRGQCYGFVPAIGLGGAYRLRYLRRFRALEHFAIIANLWGYRWINRGLGTSRHVRDVQQ